MQELNQNVFYCTISITYINCFYICVVCIPIAVRRCEETFQSSCVDGTCLPVVKECDGHRDCVDGSDEEDCVPLQPLCRPDEIGCGGVGDGCVFKGYLCDGVDNCIDGSDENCSKSVVCTMSVCLSISVCLFIFLPVRLSVCLCMSVFVCLLSVCLFVCLSHIISIAGITPSQSLCLANQFPCTDGCVPLAVVCDRTSDCRNSEDEQSCGKLQQ